MNALSPQHNYLPEPPSVFGAGGIPDPSLLQLWKAELEWRSITGFPQPVTPPRPEPQPPDPEKP